MNLAVYLNFDAECKMRIGSLREIDRDTAFAYDAGFLAMGLNPAPFRLPLRSGWQVYDRSGNMDTFGIFEDSLPDGWGRRLVDVAYHGKYGRRPTVLERLSCVGDGGMGALSYEPEETFDDSDGAFDLASLANASMDFDAGRAVDVLPEMRRAGGSSGGARPKAYIGFNPETGEVCAERDTLPPEFEHWLVKFNMRREGDRAGAEEYRYHQLALAAGVNMMPCRLIETKAGSFFATRRFDRTDGGGRLHFASAAGLLHADFRTPGDEYAILFSLTDALTHDYSAKLELFRRVSLNVLAHNRDDHLKNFGYLMDSRGNWSLSPFYDFTHSDGPNGWQTLSVAGEGRNPGVADLKRLAADADIRPSDASAIIGRVADLCSALEA